MFVWCLTVLYASVYFAGIAVWLVLCFDSEGYQVKEMCRALGEGLVDLFVQGGRFTSESLSAPNLNGCQRRDHRLDTARL